MKSEENQELESTEGLFLKKMRNSEIKNEKDEIYNIEEKIKRKDLKHEINKDRYDFQ